MNRAEAIKKGLEILLGYGEVDIAVEHDVFYAGCQKRLTPPDKKAMENLGWRWDKDDEGWKIFV